MRSGTVPYAWLFGCPLLGLPAKNFCAFFIDLSFLIDIQSCLYILDRHARASLGSVTANICSHFVMWLSLNGKWLPFLVAFDKHKFLILLWSIILVFSFIGEVRTFGVLWKRSFPVPRLASKRMPFKVWFMKCHQSTKHVSLVMTR